jgi:pteridine reductase
MSEGNAVALVTGGARRVGRAIVERLAASGCDAALTFHRSGRAAQELVETLRAQGRRAVAIEADLSDPEPAADLIYREIRQHFGRLDVLVNNASIYTPAALGQTDGKLLRALDAVHVQAPLLLCQRFDLMLRVARGHVINMLDLLAEKPWPRYMAYCASKAALWNLTLSLARELAPEVTVNGIAPGVVEWPDDMPPAQREQYLEKVPLRRAGTPQDVAALVEFLVTRGTYITGQVIRLDGGRSIA